MTDRNFKPDSGTDLVFEDAGSTDRLRITDGGSTVLYDEGGDAALTIDTDGDIQIANNIDSPGLVVQRSHAAYGSSQGLNVASEPNSTSGVTTSNYISSGLTASLTPKKTSNKILVICSYIYGMNSDITAMSLIRRTGPSVANSAGIGSGGDARKASNVLYPFGGGHSSGDRYSASIIWEDTAQDTTTSHVYTFCGSCTGTGTEFYLNGTNTDYVGQSTITILEIMV